MVTANCEGEVNVVADLKKPLVAHLVVELRMVDLVHLSLADVLYKVFVDVKTALFDASALLALRACGKNGLKLL